MSRNSEGSEAPDRAGGLQTVFPLEKVVVSQAGQHICPVEAASGEDKGQHFTALAHVLYMPDDHEVIAEFDGFVTPGVNPGTAICQHGRASRTVLVAELIEALGGVAA